MQIDSISETREKDHLTILNSTMSCIRDIELYGLVRDHQNQASYLRVTLYLRS